MKYLNDKQISALESAGLRDVITDNSHFCVFSPRFKRLLLESGIVHKYKLTAKELDVYVESLELAYDPEYINQTGAIAVWNDYILYRDLPDYKESIINQIMNDLEHYIQTLVDNILK